MSETKRGSSPSPSGKENETKVNISKGNGSANGFVSKTPSKHRVSLGAPANFYFKYVNSSKKAVNTSTSFLDASTLHDEENVTDTISIPGLNKSVTMADNSILSIGASISGSSSEGDADMLNRSTLSDTTDLTASSFVLQATSRQVMRQMIALSAKKQPTIEARIDTELHTLPTKAAVAISGDAEVFVNSDHAQATQEATNSQGKMPTSSWQLIDQHSEEISMDGATFLRRRSTRDASPSLMQRMSTTPQSLKKLTEELKVQRMKRQVKQDAMRRLSIESKNSIQSLNAQLESLNHDEIKDAATLDRKRLPPPFGLPTSRAVDKESGLADGSSFNFERKTLNPTQVNFGAAQHILATQQDENSSSQSTPTTSGTGIETSNKKITNLDSIPKSIAILKHSPPENPFESPSERGQSAEAPSSCNSSSSPMTTTSAAMSSRLTPGPTPTKLRSTPRRITNPKALDSPARNTRSSVKKNKCPGDPVDVARSKQSRLSMHDHALSFLEDVSKANVESPLSEYHTSRLESERADNSKCEPPQIDESTVREGEGDTASLGDLFSVFGEKRDKNLLMNDSITTSTEPVRTTQDQEEGEDVHSVKSKGSSDAKSLHPPSLTSTVPVSSDSQKARTPLLQDQSEVLDCPRDDVSTAHGAFKSEISTCSSDKGINEMNLTDRHLSICSDTRCDDEISANSEVDEEKGTTNDIHLSKSPTQSEGDTASIGDISAVFGRSQNSFTSRNTDLSSSTPFSTTNSFEPGSVSPNYEYRPTPQSVGQNETSVSSRDEVVKQNCFAPVAATSTGSPFSPAETLSPPSINESETSYARIRTQFSQTPRDIHKTTSPDPCASDKNSPSVTSESKQITSSAALADLLSQPQHSSQDLEDKILSASHAPGLTHSPSTSVLSEVNEVAVKSNSVTSPGLEEPKSSPATILSKSDTSRKRSRLSSTEALSGEFTSVTNMLTLGTTTLTPNHKIKDPITPTRHSWKSPLRLTPNSHKKPTPTKLALSPKRILNPYHVNSPKNTRSATKEVSDPEEHRKLAVVHQHSGSKRHFSDLKVNDKAGHETDTENEFQGIPGISFDDKKSYSSKKRRKSSILPTFHQKENFIQASPIVKKFQPIGILSSRKKTGNRTTHRSSQRSVAFGSPEAAEYHIDSPSVSMTPMPPSKAKALFVIPRATSTVNDCSVSIDGGDHTVEIEADLNVLVDKITIENMKESPQLSPISNARDGTGPVILPGNYNLAIQSCTMSVPHTQKSACESRTSESKTDENTVELEGGMERLIATMLSTTKNVSLHPSPQKGYDFHTIDVSTHVQSDLSPAESSVEMTDAQSIASLNSAKSDKFTSTLRLDAQKLDFSLNQSETSSVQRENESINPDGGNTVELESGMTSLLAAAGIQGSILGITKINPQMEPHTNLALSPKERQPLQFVDESQITQVFSADRLHDQLAGIATHSRNTTLSSRPFTLSSHDEIKICLDRSIVASEPSFTDECSYSLNLETKEQNASLSLDPEPLTLTFEEILRSASVSGVILQPPPRPDVSDSLVNFNVLAMCASEPASERWNQFLQAVCLEVERRTEGDCAASDAMSTIFDSEPKRFADLQRKLRSSDNAKLLVFLQKLVTESQRVISFEWDTWLATVMESFGSPLNEVESDLEGRFSSWDQMSREHEQIHDAIALKKLRRIQKARRTSLKRKRLTLCELHDEIRHLENTITECKSLLIEATTSELEFDRLFAATNDLKVISEDCEQMQHLVKSSQRDYLSLKGLHTWNPLEVGEAVVSLSYIGHCKNSCSKLVCELSDAKNLRATILKDSEAQEGMKTSLRKYSGPIASFLSVNIRNLAEKLRSDLVQQLPTVTHHIQNYMWSMGRLDSTASELQGLMNRYNGKLIVTSDNSFLINIDFQGLASNLSVVVEVKLSYPSVPLVAKIEVCKGCIDVEVIEKALAKNATPGFGYLSRLCDIVSAFVE